MEAFGYKEQTQFEITFEHGEKTHCIALEPPEKHSPHQPWSLLRSLDLADLTHVEYHLAPEIFVSDGWVGSVVGDWVKARDNIGGIHHLAYQVDDVEKIMREWRDKGYAEFLSDKPLECPGLTQVFTKPSIITGVIYEFIRRDSFGFCQENVGKLMESTKGQ